MVCRHCHGVKESDKMQITKWSTSEITRINE